MKFNRFKDKSCKKLNPETLPSLSWGTLSITQPVLRIMKQEPAPEPISSPIGYGELFKILTEDIPNLCVHYFFSTYVLLHTPPPHEAACYGGTWRCRQSRFIKRLGLFFSPSQPPHAPTPESLLTSTLWYGGSAYDLSFWKAGDNRRAVVIARRLLNLHVADPCFRAADHDTNIYPRWWMRESSLCSCHQAIIRMCHSLRCRISDSYL